MLSRTAARVILVMRHREGLGSAFWPDTAFASSTGERFRDLPGGLFCDQEGNQPRVDPGLRKLRLLGCELVQIGEAFHSLEGKFDLPAEAIDCQHV